MAGDGGLEVERDGARLGRHRAAAHGGQGGHDELKVRAAGEEALDIDHVDAGLVFGVRGRGREGVEQIHRAEDEAAAPGDRLPAHPDDEGGRAVGDAQPVDRVGRQHPVVIRERGGQIQQRRRRLGDQRPFAPRNRDARAHLHAQHVVQREAPAAPGRLPDQAEVRECVVGFARAQRGVETVSGRDLQGVLKFEPAVQAVVGGLRLGAAGGEGRAKRQRRQPSARLRPQPRGSDCRR